MTSRAPKNSLFFPIIFFTLDILVDPFSLNSSTARTRPDSTCDTTLVEYVINVLQLETFGFWEEESDDDEVDCIQHDEHEIILP